jgi:two-component system LytT family response regulator
VKKTAIIVDDEPQARQKLERLLKEHQDEIQVVGHAGDGVAAVEAIEQLAPEVVFLDIQMPGLGGFGVLDSIPLERWPLVVFTTAFEQYAPKAFDVAAVDYLLKPITRERLAACVSRLGAGAPPAERTQPDKSGRKRALERILVRRSSKLIVIPIDDVAVFESEDKLVFVRAAAGRFALNMSMKEIEERVDSDVFCRVHKQAIVRLSEVREINAMPGGQYLARLSDGYEVQVSRNFAHDFRSRFG